MAGKIIQQVVSKALQGDIRAALEIMHKIPNNKLSKRDLRFKKRFIQRFSDDSVSVKLRCTDNIVKELYEIYCIYWHAILLKRVSPEKAESALFEQLSIFMKNNDISNRLLRNRTNIENKLKDFLAEKRYFSLFGIVQPFREFEIWKSQKEENFTVNLPETRQNVKVVLMEKFISKGWEAYATIDRAFPGGWAKKDRLFCNASSYDFNTERFLVSYLTHEAQHFFDYKRFPKLCQLDLEYRAKLAELSVAIRSGKKLMRGFYLSANKNIKYPHSYANYIVTKDILDKLHIGKNLSQLHKVRIKDINIVADSLLKNNSKMLLNKRAKTVISIFKDYDSV